MANTCDSSVYFFGNEGKLNKIVDNIITIEKNRKTLSYKLIEDLIPKEKDETLYESLGINYTDYLLNFSEEKKENARQKLNIYLKKHNYIGTNQDYINRRIWEFDYTLKDNKLILELQSAWHCPVNFFIYIAENFNVDFLVYEAVEGNSTTLYYKEEKNIKEVELNIDNLLYNHTFQEHLLKNNIYSPTHLALASYLKGDTYLFNKLINDKQIKDDDYFSLIEKEISILKEIEYYKFMPICFMASLYDIEDIPRLEKAKEDYNKYLNYRELSQNLHKENKNISSYLKI